MNLTPLSTAIVSLIIALILGGCRSDGRQVGTHHRESDFFSEAHIMKGANIDNVLKLRVRPNRFYYLMDFSGAIYAVEFRAKPNALGLINYEWYHVRTTLRCKDCAHLDYGGSGWLSYEDKNAYKESEKLGEIIIAGWPIDWVANQNVGGSWFELTLFIQDGSTVESGGGASYFKVYSYSSNGMQSPVSHNVGEWHGDDRIIQNALKSWLLDDNFINGND